MQKQYCIPAIVLLVSVALVLAGCGTVTVQAGASSPVATSVPAMTATPPAPATPAATLTATLVPSPTPDKVMAVMKQGDKAEDEGVMFYIPSGTRVLVRYRSSDGHWYYVRPPDDARFKYRFEYPDAYQLTDELYTDYPGTSVWVPAADLEFESSPDGLEIYDPESTPEPISTPVPTPTLTPLPFAAVTSTPAPCNADGSCPFIHLVLLPEEVQRLQQTWLDYIDFISFRNGPPPADYAEQLKKYLADCADCAYRPMVTDIAGMLANDTYVRLRPLGKMQWQLKEPWNEVYRMDNYDPPTYHSTELSIHPYLENGMVLELVDSRTGAVLKTVTDPAALARSETPGGWGFFADYDVSAGGWRYRPPAQHYRCMTGEVRGLAVHTCY